MFGKLDQDRKSEIRHATLIVQEWQVVKRSRGRSAPTMAQQQTPPEIGAHANSFKVLRDLDAGDAAGGSDDLQATEETPGGAANRLCCCDIGIFGFTDIP
jgi:hypothetical protein